MTHTEERLTELSKAHVQNIKEQFAAEILENGETLYRVDLQGRKLECYYTDEEMLTIARNCVLLVNALEKRLDDGLSTEDMERARQLKYVNRVETISEELAILDNVQQIMTAEMWGMYNEIASAVRVGGAYLLFIAGPVFRSAINSAFDMLERYNAGAISDEQLPNHKDYCVYFLIRAAMHMHSKDLTDTQSPS